MNLNTIPGIVKAIVELRCDVNALRKANVLVAPVAPVAPVVDAEPEVARRGRPRKFENSFTTGKQVSGEI